MGKLDAINQGIARLAESQRRYEMDEVHGEESALDDALCKAVSSLDATIDVASQASTQAIAGIDAATNKGLEKALKAHATVGQGAISALSESSAESTAVIAPLLEAIAKSNASLAAAIRYTGQKETPRPIHFDIERDGNGYMKTVTARPVDGSEPETIKAEYA
mgnify:CR=1 FL=1